jgi:hypothetical protein
MAACQITRQAKTAIALLGKPRARTSPSFLPYSKLNNAALTTHSSYISLLRTILMPLSWPSRQSSKRQTAKASRNIYTQSASR